MLCNVKYALACEIRLDGEWVDLISLDAIASNFTLYGVNYFTVSASERFH